MVIFREPSGFLTVMLKCPESWKARAQSSSPRWSIGCPGPGCSGGLVSECLTLPNIQLGVGIVHTAVLSKRGVYVCVCVCVWGGVVVRDQCHCDGSTVTKQYHCERPRDLAESSGLVSLSLKLDREHLVKTVYKYVSPIPMNFHHN